MIRIVLMFYVGWMSNSASAQSQLRIPNPEKFPWSNEVNGLQVTAAVLSGRPSFFELHPAKPMMGPDLKPLTIRLVRPDSAVAGLVTETPSSLGGLIVVLRNVSSHTINVSWTGGESRCDVWDSTGRQLPEIPLGVSIPPAPAVPISLQPGGILSEYESLSSAYGRSIFMKPLGLGAYTVHCWWGVVLDEGEDPHSHRHRFNQDLQISAPEMTLRVVGASGR